MSPKFLIV
ncbi:hypothetical protein CGLO_10865 [Colletotrichum gloeosporioides Cg-14]|uniref:Uncharacterized protein n=1 Tax=Colletotrichum gloeosporioides (strain Cg-14) TaxID=1237896 RepID=T0K295_COLGC|nr:hypothetical protein CGLO_10865 [Colletotrichum gloeosporioides Cg-14]